MLHRIARFEVQGQHVDKARALIQAYTDEVGRKEGGTAHHEAYQEEGAPTRFILRYAFRTPSAEDYHQKTAWRQRFLAELAPLCTQAPVETTLVPLA